MSAFGRKQTLTDAFSAPKPAISHFLAFGVSANDPKRTVGHDRPRPTTDFCATQKAEILLSYESQHGGRAAKNTKRK